MKTSKTFKIIMLPTEKASHIQLHNGKLIYYNREREYGDVSMRHLYILSDEEIKEGDWVLYSMNGKQWVGKISNYIVTDWCKKIIATTDKSIWIKGAYEEPVSPYPIYLPQVPESFTQAYIKAYNEGKPITEVDLEMEEFIPDTISYGLHGNDEPPTEQRIKTRPNNTVIIHRSAVTDKQSLLNMFGNYILLNNIKLNSSNYVCEVVNEFLKSDYYNR